MNPLTGADKPQRKESYRARCHRCRYGFPKNGRHSDHRRDHPENRRPTRQLSCFECTDGKKDQPDTDDRTAEAPKDVGQQKVKKRNDVPGHCDHAPEGSQDPHLLALEQEYACQGGQHDQVEHRLNPFLLVSHQLCELSGDAQQADQNGRQTTPTDEI